MASWPTTGSFPQYCLQGSYQESPADQTVRFETDSGAAKVRRRTTSRPVVWRGTFRITNSQLATFESFFQSDIDYGAVTFTMPHQRTQVSKTMRIANPAYQISHVDGDIYDLALEFEIIS